MQIVSLQENDLNSANVMIVLKDTSWL